MIDEGDTTALLNWLRTAVPGLTGPITVSKFTGGQSNPTYCITAADSRYVLRRKPFGALLTSAHALEREFRVLTALYPLGFPVPRPLALCSDETVLGSVFYVMEFVQGQIFWNPMMPSESSTTRRAVYKSMIATLGRLHQLDPPAIGLADFGRPGNYFSRQIVRWTRQYRATQTDDVPEIERLIEWLPQTVPQQTRTSLIHGDFRIDNVIYSLDEPRIVAVIDWELATIGDPLADFAYLAMNWAMPADGRSGLADIDLTDTGIPAMKEVVSLYCQATGRDELPELHWYFAFNLFRLCGIVQGVKKRLQDGNASSEHAEEAAAKVTPFAEAAWLQARLAGAC